MAKKIFIVEDEAALLYALEAKFRLEGFEVETAADGEEALKALRNYKPDLIVLDIILPKMDGWAVMQMIRADANLVSVPVVIVTNLTDKHSREKGVDLGAVNFLVKSDFDLEDLVDKIKAVFKKDED
jgi:DNA-binding response OmpR family regulator